MAYKQYIKKDYKPVSEWHPKREQRPMHVPLMAGVALVCLGAFAAVNALLTREVPYDVAPSATTRSLELPLKSDILTTNDNLPAKDPVSLSVSDNIDIQETAELPVVTEAWQTIEVKRGDSLSLIFDRLGISPTVLHQIVTLDKNSARLKRIIPGQKLSFLMEDKQLVKLKYEPDLVTTLSVNKQDDTFISELTVIELEKRTRETEGVINDSLFLAGQKAGLSDNLIMQLVTLFTIR